MCKGIQSLIKKYNLKVQKKNFILPHTHKKVQEIVFLPIRMEKLRKLYCVGGEYKETEYGENTNWYKYQGNNL